MKYKVMYLSAILFGILSCSKEAIVPEDLSNSQNDQLSIVFEKPILTRTTGTSILGVGTLFKVYAYNQGTRIEDATVPVAEGTYKVTSNGGVQAIESLSGKDLRLYAGTYDLYFVSANSIVDANVPSVSSGSLITGLDNGKDFLYTSMKNVGVRSVNAGDTNFLITLNKPFRRMCSALLLKVKAKTGSHPVLPRSLKLISATISHLSGKCNFLLGNEFLPVFFEAAEYTGSCTLNPDLFQNNEGAVSSDGAITTAIPTTGIYQVLPTSGSAILEIDIVLEVGYQKNNDTNIIKGQYPYKITVNKALQAGRCYEFTFNLTFYDNYVPDNLELDIVPYIESNQDTGHVGG